MQCIGQWHWNDWILWEICTYLHSINLMQKMSPREISLADIVQPWDSVFCYIISDVKVSSRSSTFGYPRQVFNHASASLFILWCGGQRCDNISLFLSRYAYTTIASSLMHRRDWIPLIGGFVLHYKGRQTLLALLFHARKNVISAVGQEKYWRRAVDFFAPALPDTANKNLWNKKINDIESRQAKQL